MKKLMSALLVIGAAVAIPATAEARDGCGRGFHRGFYGHCRPNGYGGPGPGPGPGPALIVGNFYGGRGYWDGHRYWERRERWQGGWRYRH